MKGYLCTVICLSVALTVRGAYKVDVESLVREVKERYADDFEQRIADGNPPGIEEMLGLTKDEDLNKQYTLTTKKAGEKIRFQQIYKRVPVFDTVVTATIDKRTKTAKDITGTIVKELSDDVRDAKPKISTQDALKIAKSDAGHSREETSGEAAELKIYMDKKCVARLVYITNYFSSSGGKKDPTRPYHVIDAKTKEIIDKWEGLTFNKLPLQGTQSRTKVKRADSAKLVKVKGVGGNEKTGKYMYDDGTPYGKLVVNSAGSVGKCNLENKNVKVVHMMNHKSRKMSPHQFTCREGNKDEVNGGYSPLNDALYFGGVIIDMYKDWIGQAPIMKKLVMRVHWGADESNAFWDGQRVNFGDGDTTEYHPWVCLDISGHEISHGFTEENSNLVFKHQSGGINEAFSDMAGEAAKYYKRGSNDWKIAADIHRGPGALRYMNDPPKDGVSIGHASAYTDKLDVHETSGVYNKAFYLLANKAGWDTKKAFVTFARANKMHWRPNTDFNEGACGVMQTAKDDGLSEKDVEDAFRQVGVECKKTKAVAKLPPCNN